MWYLRNIGTKEVVFFKKAEFLTVQKRFIALAHSNLFLQEKHEVYLQFLLADSNIKTLKRSDDVLEDTPECKNKKSKVSQESVNKLCLNVVVEKMLPFDTVSCESFKKLIKG